MNIIYNRLFNLNFGHNYYKNGKAKGVDIYPTQETTKRMANGQMLFKKVSGDVVLLYRTQDDEVTPLIDMGSDLRLTFYLTAEDKQQFFNVTNLDESPTKRISASNIIYFTNNPAAASNDPNSPESIAHTILDSLRSPLFTYEFQLIAGPAQVLFRVADANGSLVSVGAETDGTPLPTTLTLDKMTGESYSQQIDLRDKPKGIYTITVRDLADTTTLKEEKVYLDGQLAGQRIFGIVDIFYDAVGGHIYGATEEYLIQFTRRETIWKYYVVDKNGKVDLAANDLLISDQGPGGGDPYNVYSFTREGAEPNADIRVNDLDTVIFKSDLPIPFFEIPKLNLELRKNPGNQEVITHLPNPSHSGVIKDDAGDLASEVHVFI